MIVCRCKARKAKVPVIKLLKSPKAAEANCEFSQSFFSRAAKFFWREREP